MMSSAPQCRQLLMNRLRWGSPKEVMGVQFWGRSMGLISWGAGSFEELGQAGVARNFERRGLKPGRPSTPLPAGCPQLGERGFELERTVALGWWSGIEASCPKGLPILKGCSVGPPEPNRGAL